MLDERWNRVVETVQHIFNGKKRKNDDYMWEHSVGVGEILKNWRLDDITIVSGCFHDVYEDTDYTLEDIYNFATKLNFSDADAKDIAGLVDACSYQKEEYDLDKKLRKVAATLRWSNHQDKRVQLIKSADIKNNTLSALSVSPQFHEEYCAWASPLELLLDANLGIQDGVYHGDISESTRANKI